MSEPEQNQDQGKGIGDEPKGGLGILFLAAALALAALLAIVALIAFALMRHGALERPGADQRHALGTNFTARRAAPVSGQA